MRYGRNSFKLLMRHSSGPVFMRSGDRPAFADIGPDIWHSQTPHPGDVAGDFGGGLHKEVPQSASDRNIIGPQRDAYSLLGVVVVVDRVVAPVSAIVVPDVVVGIRIFIFNGPISAKGVGHRLSQGWNLKFFYLRS